MLALASPASLKGVLAPAEAAAHLAAGLRRAVDAVEAPVADGGEGTADVLRAALGGECHRAAVTDPFGREIEARWLLLPDGTAVVESAEAIGLTRVAGELDPLRATTHGLGELLLKVLDAEPPALLIGVGGTATVDGGAGMRAVVGRRLAGVSVRIACDVRNPLLGPRGAARVFGPQKGADAVAVAELEARLTGLDELAPYRDLTGAGAGGGLGAAFAALGAELCDGAQLILDLIGFDALARPAALVVTGEGTIDATTLEGKAPGAVVHRCERLGVRCELFGGIVRDGVRAHALSGDPSRAREDLAALGETLGLGLLERS
ncbi:MAG: glycerate kinase [Gaiellaceae bacterium]